MPGGVVWASRAAGVVLIVIATISEPSRHRALVLAGLAVVGGLLVAWAAMDARFRPPAAPPPWALGAVLAAVSVVGGLLTGLLGGFIEVWLVVIATVGAGTDLAAGAGGAVAATGILGLEVSTLAFGRSAEDAVIWPLLVVVSLLFGRSRRDARVLRAQGAALAAQAERTEAEQRRAATLDERARVARDIHDLLAHTLGALGIQLETVHAVLVDTGDLPRAARLVEDARGMAAAGLAETRNAVRALRADTPPLPQSIAGLVERHEQEHGTAVDVVVDGTPRPVSADATLALVRTAGEALVNAARHATATPVRILLVYGPGEITMTVSNELGPAAHGSAGREGGYGLAGMRERLQLIGGTLTAGPSDTAWTVQARVPA